MIVNGLCLCGTCHTLVEHDPEVVVNESNESHESMVPERSWWRCAGCKAADKPIQQFRLADELHAVAQRKLQLWKKQCKAGGPNDLWKCKKVLPGPQSSFLEMIGSGKPIVHFIRNPDKEQWTVTTSSGKDLMNYGSEMVSCFRVCSESFAVKTTEAAVGVESLLGHDFTVSPRNFTNAIIQYREDNPADVLVLIYVPMLLPQQSSDERIFAGNVLLIDVLSPRDPKIRLKALEHSFLDELAQSTIDAYQTPNGEEQICTVIYGNYKAKKQQSLNCNICFPTKKSRRGATKQFSDSSTATISSNRHCTSCRFDKAWGVEHIWPNCLPKDRQRSFHWLESPTERKNVVKEIIGGATGKFYCPRSTMRMYTFESLCYQAVRGADTDHVRSLVEDISPNEYVFSVRYGFSGQCRSIMTKGKFQKPALQTIRKASHDMIEMRIGRDLKKCAFCNKEEEVTRSYSRCSRCKDCYYFCREHQMEHWSETGMRCRD